MSATTAAEDSCTKFNDVFFKIVRDETMPKMNSKHFRVHAVRYFTDKNHTKLFSLSNITSDKKEFWLSAQIYPDLEILDISPWENIRKDPPHIEKWISDLKEISPDNYLSGNQIPIDAAGYNVSTCLPTRALADASEFEDGKYRSFMRHYKYANIIRGGGKWGCDRWEAGNDLMIFYQGFLPSKFTVSGKTIFVDAAYLGVMEDGETSFKYPCDLNRILEARMKILEKKPEEIKNTKDLFESHGIPWNKKTGAWETEVLRNILEGSSAY